MNWKALILLLMLIGSSVLLRGSEGSYNFFMISDPHFGTAKSYCTDPKAERKHRTRKNIHRADRAMRHYKALFAHIAKSADPKTAFIVEAGDLIEGCTWNEATHKQVLLSAVKLMKDHFKFPIYMVKGNHEAAGRGGNAAYKAVLLPEMAKYAGVKSLTEANYVIRRGKDIFVFLDYSSRKWYDFLKNTLSSLKEKPRWVFAVIHIPLLPGWAAGKLALQAVELLSEYNGIVLCGHQHNNSVTHYTKNGKKVIQVSVSTLLIPGASKRMAVRKSKATLEWLKTYHHKRASKYKSLLSKLERDWVPYVTDYTLFSGMGYARFQVSDQGVSVEFCGADLKSSAKVQLKTVKK